MYTNYVSGNRDNVVGIAIRYMPNGPAIYSQCGLRYSAPGQSESGTHQASYTMGNVGNLGVKG
jgi:hypothetical protein